MTFYVIVTCSHLTGILRRATIVGRSSERFKSKLKRNINTQQKSIEISFFSLSLFSEKYPRIYHRPILDSRTYDSNRQEVQIGRKEQEKVRKEEEEQEEGDGYETSDDESCDLENGDFDTMSSCRSRSRSCCSVTTVANDDFEYFQRKGTKVTFFSLGTSFN